MMSVVQAYLFGIMMFGSVIVMIIFMMFFIEWLSKENEK